MKKGKKSRRRKEEWKKERRKKERRVGGRGDDGPILTELDRNPLAHRQPKQSDSPSTETRVADSCSVDIHINLKATARPLGVLSSAGARVVCGMLWGGGLG